MQTFGREFHCHLGIAIGPLPTTIVNVQGTVFPIEDDLTALPNEKLEKLSGAGFLTTQASPISLREAGKQHPIVCPRALTRGRSEGLAL